MSDGETDDRESAVEPASVMMVGDRIVGVAIGRDPETWRRLRGVAQERIAQLERQRYEERRRHARDLTMYSHRMQTLLWEQTQLRADWAQQLKMWAEEVQARRDALREALEARVAAMEARKDALELSVENDRLHAQIAELKYLLAIADNSEKPDEEATELRLTKTTAEIREAIRNYIKLIKKEGL